MSKAKRNALSQFDARLDLAEEFRRIVGAPRDRLYVKHEVLLWLRPRIDEIAAG